MLSQKTIEIVKSTVPLLQEKGVDITTRFYQIMFAEHPELLNIFNHTNQKIGRQQQALASAVCAAAMYIDHLEAIIPVVKQIGHKHRSLGIKAEHYPIVGNCLLQAIKEVAGAPQEVLDAWGEAYGVIADAFIRIEAEMYEEAAKKEGGWKELRNFIVVKKEKESDVITSFYLKPEDGGELSMFLPGQYVTVQIRIEGETYIHNRQYSLSDAPGKEYYRISVKRETSAEAPDGKVSNYLHDHVHEGDILPLSAPAGDFVLNIDSNLPVVLISGGVGITPMMSMFNTLTEREMDRDVYFIHAALNSKVHAMKEHVQKVAESKERVKVYTCYSAPTKQDVQAENFEKEGLIDLAWLQSIIPSNEAEFYFCGPVPFMKHINAVLLEWGVPADRIHYEFFGPAVSLQ
ncbi:MULTISPECIES: NO-inducible flavohemoprotein [Bacillus cereus group]|uniref:Flavohemoprotein n=2 Tax=Bacillus cytotoxicus TaxID=580165 RepID=A0AAX2CEL8_9BACI|nr:MULTISPECIES: NO-inducible flavohemoprotein [Bacillus cereus group]ABS21496.1 oxidoreductase FAD/NAD(P)-binding domain protein [Bacillus cytotoxicus NVH 391-98]AWC28140.1 NO-inducible flavohemoprotein [Bacillus cytotoxicus]AWC40477.1 NO-inducible flavohemoprotein [Bacillus cytotoxicus]AWC44203.1 NO-inducible flavohemoprotein [Bacillus cytotoxicus]AWC48408.1 NO-inducible flavohemoprotein [Bacillus cytotoxicus]